MREVDWTFDGMWPHPPRWFDTPDGRLHYIDEGPPDGRPVVLVHGNPTWGFLYREFVGPLTAAGYRVVVPDLLGFGRSDKPADARVYRVDRHARRLAALLDSLDLRGAVPVGQDWGGLVYAWAADRPERVAGLFILNTTVHNPETRFKVPFALHLFRAPGLGEVTVKGLALFHRLFLFRVGLAHPERLTPRIKAAYLAPHRTWASRTGVLAFPREIPVRPDGPWAGFFLDLEARLSAAYRDRPVRFVWAMKDPAFTPEILRGRWLRNLPHAEVVELPDAGHYLQEDAHELIVPQLLDFLASLGEL